MRTVAGAKEDICSEAAKFSADGLTKAIEHYRVALAVNPAYAPAYAGLANAYFMLGQPMGALPHREAMLDAKSAALKALELDASLSSAYTALGFVTFVYDWDWEVADQMKQYPLRLVGICKLHLNHPGAQLTALSIRTRPNR